MKKVKNQHGESFCIIDGRPCWTAYDDEAKLFESAQEAFTFLSNLSNEFLELFTFRAV